MQMKGLEVKASIYKALGDPIRLKIVDFLMGVDKCSCICKLSETLGRDKSVIFRHLQILKEAGIIETNKSSRYLFCCISDKRKIRKLLEVWRMAKNKKGFLGKLFDKLDEKLEKKSKEKKCCCCEDSACEKWGGVNLVFCLLRFFGLMTKSVPLLKGI